MVIVGYWSFPSLFLLWGSNQHGWEEGKGQRTDCNGVSKMKVPKYWLFQSILVHLMTPSKNISPQPHGDIGDPTTVWWLTSHKFQYCMQGLSPPFLLLRLQKVCNQICVFEFDTMLGFQKRKNKSDSSTNSYVCMPNLCFGCGSSATCVAHRSPTKSDKGPWFIAQKCNQKYNHDNSNLI